MRRRAMWLCVAAFWACNDGAEVARPGADAFRPPADAAADARRLDGAPDVRVTDATADQGPGDAEADDVAIDAVAQDAVPLDATIDGHVVDAMPLDAMPLDAMIDGGAVDAIVDAVINAAPDLEPDGPPPPAVHRVFVTAAELDANLGGVVGADARCAAAAEAAGLQGVWRALISDEGVAARDHVVVRGPIETIAGARVAENAADLWDDSLRHAIDSDETGAPLAGNLHVWTGTDGDGDPDAQPNTWCNGWGTRGEAAGAVDVGRADQRDHRWISLYGAGASAYGCRNRARLYCLDGQ
ncbi:MAG: hypothetical protein KC620_09070 [Myxococcales bacterium]|nr:hypothetical protein [Myxococcales bacterium]